MFSYNIINYKDFQVPTSKMLGKTTFIAVQGSKTENLAHLYEIFGESFVTDFQQSTGFSAETCSHIATTVPYLDNVAGLALLGAGTLEEPNSAAYVRLGVAAADLLKNSKESFIFVDIKDSVSLSDFLVGIDLGTYKFDKYFVDKASKEPNILDKKLNLIVSDELDIATTALAIDLAKITADSVILARNLVNEPANILDTTMFKQNIEQLSSTGLEVEILAAEQLQKLGMNALLAVAQGSKNPPYVAIMRWNGADDVKKAPLVFVGKGVVFDSGGISIKPAVGMEDMKGDMGGAAAVTGLMHLLAMRKSKVNAIGLVGLVENMPSGEAMRPGDVVRSMSGQTIEIINTDAEGRLVLADLLHYAKEIFSPACIVNLATLTGAMLVALGNYYAGLFSNDTQLSSQLLESAKETGEKLWRLPLSREYDEMINSKIADMKNSSGRYAGSITAAQFLKRFVGETRWAHLDIVGTAFGVKKYPYGSSWATGFGVRLLDRFVQKYYEA